MNNTSYLIFCQDVYEIIDIWRPLLIPVEIAVVAVAPADCSEPLQPSGSGRQVDLGPVGLVAESGSVFAPPAEVKKELIESNRGIQNKLSIINCCL